MVSFWNVTVQNKEIYTKRRETLITFVQRFYEQHRNGPNVLSPEKVYRKHDSSSLLIKTIWHNKEFLRKGIYKGRSIRDIGPVFFGVKSGLSFGSKSGMCFKADEVYFLYDFESFHYHHLPYHWLRNLEFRGNQIVYPHWGGSYPIRLSDQDLALLKDFLIELKRIAVEFDLELRAKAESQMAILKQDQLSVLARFSEDDNGTVELIENDLPKLISKNQAKMIDVDRSYVQKFVKVSNYLDVKKQNIQRIFDSIIDTESNDELTELSNSLQDQIHTYNSIIFHSLNMIAALADDDMMTYYEIYEVFDKLGIFNSNWENEVASQLNNIGDQLYELIHTINEMESKIVNEVRNLNYMMNDSFNKLNNSVNQQLNEIGSTIKFNNLLTSVQIYQLHKVDQNTKQISY